MSKSPLNHKQSRGIAGLASGLFGRKNRGNSNTNDPNALNNVKALAKKGGIHGALGRLALQQSGGDAINNANAMQNEALNNVENTGVVNPIDIQKNQVAEASGLTALTEGPVSAGSSIIPQKQGTLADQQYNSILGGLNTNTAFANKSPLKLAEVTSKDFAGEYGGAYSQGGYQGILEPDDDGDGVTNKQESIMDTAASMGDAAQSIISNLQGKNEKKEKTTRKQRLQAKIDSTDNPAKKERMQGRLDRINMRQKGRAARGKIKNKLQGQFVQGAQNIKNKLWGVDNENSEVEVNTENKKLLQHDLKTQELKDVYGDNWENYNDFLQTYKYK